MYRSLKQCVDDLEKHGHLVRIEAPIDGNLEAAEIQRRVYRSGGPAVYFSKINGSPFPAVSNLFGTLERARFIFRKTFENVQRAIQLKVDPGQALKQPLRYWKAPFIAWQMRPKLVRSAAVTRNQTTIGQLPPIKSWPDDGGAFITLPQVYSEDARQPGCAKSNLGMYRVQLSGGQYQPDREVGLHYQIQRGIGVHHRAALEAGKPFRVNIFLGGTPAMTLAAVMPLPEGMSELTFAGALSGHRIPMMRSDQSAIYADADFCIVGTVDPNRLLPEGPFGDHLGYYSLAHDFPVLQVEKVYHRDGAIWPFTVVGRPPQEDTVFGDLIHELTGPVIPTVLPGIKAVHAVDVAGVHPLLLAIGSERYVPYQPTTEPQEILTQANAILGQGQMSLAKYLFILDQACDPQLDIRDMQCFFQRLLERVDWRRDLHFQTKTTIDTLDYSGTGFNSGSKVVIAAAGPSQRTLATEVPSSLSIPTGFKDPQVCMPGVVAISAPAATEGSGRQAASSEPHSTDLRSPILRFCASFPERAIEGFPLVVLVDDSEFTARTLENFLWVVFTRSNPATDLYGIGEFTEFKHWGCPGSLVIDARIKPHHAPPLIEDRDVSKRIDAMAAKGGPLAKWI